jgi:hypothetical protein
VFGGLGDEGDEAPEGEAGAASFVFAGAGGVDTRVECFVRWRTVFLAPGSAPAVVTLSENNTTVASSIRFAVTRTIMPPTLGPKDTVSTHNWRVPFCRV